MSIAQINEKLLRTIGVGVALASNADLAVEFCNGRFAKWFGEPAAGALLPDILVDLDIDAMRMALGEGRSYDAELTVKPRRRSLIIAVSISLADVEGDGLLVIECQNITRIRELEAMIDSYSRMVERNTRELEREKERAERLLLNIMPKSVYEEFRTFGVVTPQRYDQVSVLMLDFVGFTEFSAKTDPTVTLGELNDLYTAFDRISEQFGCERIKTIGDAYLAVAGMPQPNPDHIRAVAQSAVRFVRYLERRNLSHPHHWECRIGIATGAVVGSVVGV